MTAPFSIGESLMFGWRETRAHSGLLFGIVVIVAALELLRYALQMLVSNIAVLLCVSLAIAVVEVVISIGATVIILKLARARPIRWRDVIPPWKLSVRYVLASLAAGCIIVCGFLPAIVGIVMLSVLHAQTSAALAWCLIAVGAIIGGYCLVRYSLVKLAVIEEGTVMAALRRSARITRGMEWRLFIFLIVILALNVAGALALLAGLLITVPVTMIALARAYVQLGERADDLSSVSANA